ncbi:hemerythrin domain-containing protein [Natribacillus halophilus]|uniref:Hemerythrin HHE cation binding domain-containing protein n=1 Tax=Natribacillus halophilus TaxID=549003 RepID=A0A1G8MY60_9BACI|nr:hemerythrin domain-containing protein [Natribacillus halophilus]SDI72823.1 Hemerythrin HHE cation binding domain-containing protein [Natribacillus halophilus]
MTSGPALRKVDSHSSIHEAALNEAREITDILEELLKKEQYEKALETAYIGVEHWETRTLQHAASEEEGLYKELAEESAELNEAVIGLTRDHDLLRLLVEEIKELLGTEGINDQVLQRFQALILVDVLHNQEEEKILPEH